MSFDHQAIVTNDRRSRHLENPESGQVTLGHPLLAIAFFTPVYSAIVELKHWGGSLLHYLIAASSTLVLGAVIVMFNWKLGKGGWLRSQQNSKKVQNATAIVLFVVDLLWIAGRPCGD